MPRIPKNPEQIFQEFTNDYKKILGDDLIAIILYGSVARGEYRHKKSDINFLIIVTDSGIKNLKKVLPLISKWKKRRVSTPLLLTNEYIKSALDSYPIEFLNIKQHYRIVYGADVLADLDIQPQHLRLQCEREVRGKLLNLREGYLNTSGKTAMIKRLIKYSIPAFSSIFSALLFLKGEAIPGSKHQIIMKTAEVFKLDPQVFEKILALEHKKSKLNKAQINDLIENYIEQIAKLTEITDKL